MKKPPKVKINKSLKISGFDLYQTVEYISSIANKDFYDYLGSGSHFNKWCDKKGYGDLDPENKKRSQSNIWYKEYVNDFEDGQDKCPKNLNIIDWFIDKFMPESKIEVFELDKSYLEEEEKEYVKEFLTLLFENFGDEVSLIFDLEN